MQEKIIHIIKSISSNPMELTGETNLFSEGVLDSELIVELIMALEENFDVEIDPEDILPENFSTVNEICALLKRQRL